MAVQRFWERVLMQNIVREKNSDFIPWSHKNRKYILPARILWELRLRTSAIVYAYVRAIYTLIGYLAIATHSGQRLYVDHIVRFFLGPLKIMWRLCQRTLAYYISGNFCIITKLSIGNICCIFHFPPHLSYVPFRWLARQVTKSDEDTQWKIPNAKKNFRWKSSQTTDKTIRTVNANLQSAFHWLSLISALSMTDSCSLDQTLRSRHITHLDNVLMGRLDW